MTLATSTGPHPVNGSASGEFERLARLATLVLNEHTDDGGLCAACRDIAFPCQFAVLEQLVLRMGSPCERRSALWDAVQAAEDRAVRDFISPAGRALAPGRGEDRSDAARRGREGQRRAASLVIVAPEVAPEIRVPRALAAALLRGVRR